MSRVVAGDAGRAVWFHGPHERLNAGRDGTLQSPRNDTESMSILTYSVDRRRVCLGDEWIPFSARSRRMTSFGGPATAQMSPRRIDSATACARSTAPSFWKITCSRFFTATSVRPVAIPISRLVAPLLA